MTSDLQSKRVTIVIYKRGYSGSAFIWRTMHTETVRQWRLIYMLYRPQQASSSGRLHGLRPTDLERWYVPCVPRSNSLQRRGVNASDSSNNSALIYRTVRRDNQWSMFQKTDSSLHPSIQYILHHVLSSCFSCCRDYFRRFPSYLRWQAVVA